MIQVRNCVFETNSSSVHSICISRDKPKKPKKVIVLDFGEYEWGCECVSSKNYLWTAILLTKSYHYDYKNDKDPDNGLYLPIPEIEAHIKKVLAEYGVESVIFRYPRLKPKTEKERKWYWSRYEDEPSIDHYGETEEFVDMCLANDDLLARTILNSDSVVYTGNDNSCDEDNLCYSSEPTIHESLYNDDGNYTGSKTMPNPNYEPDKFDYFMKGN